MDSIPLVGSEIKAGLDFLDEFGRAYPIDAAFWLKTADSKRWELYVVSSRIVDENFVVAIDEMLRITREKKNLRLNPFSIRILKMRDPIAKCALDLFDRRSVPLESAYPIDSFGGMDAEQIFLYPPLQTAA